VLGDDPCVIPSDARDGWLSFSRALWARKTKMATRARMPGRRAPWLERAGKILVSRGFRPARRPSEAREPPSSPARRQKLASRAGHVSPARELLRLARPTFAARERCAKCVRMGHAALLRKRGNLFERCLV